MNQEISDLVMSTCTELGIPKTPLILDIGRLRSLGYDWAYISQSIKDNYSGVGFKEYDAKPLNSPVFPAEGLSLERSSKGFHSLNKQVALGGKGPALYGVRASYSSSDQQ